MNGRVQHFDPNEVVVFGRDAGVAVHVADPGVSRAHARLALEPDGWVLADLGSTNGTYVGGRRIDRQVITGAVTVSLGNPTAATSVRIEPLRPVTPAVTAPSPTSRAAQPTLATTAILLLLIAGISALGVGVFALDWITVTYTDTSEGFVVSDRLKPELDTNVVSLIAGGISGMVGFLGIQRAISRTVSGSLLIVGGLVIGGWTASVLATNLHDVSWVPPGFEELQADARFALGAYVTLFGAVTLAVSGIVSLLDRRRAGE